MNASNQPARLRPFRPQPFGRYTLLSHLATGGMGEIYLARLEGAQGFEKLCVIKKVLPQFAEDADFVERFVGEARTLVRLSHGSIAQVLDMGLHEGEAYMALEHVDGKDLRKVAARVRDRQVPLPLTFILYVMGRVLDALAYAHRKKDDDGEDLRLVHRDISPQNILISYEGEVKVVDFGLAKSRLSAAKTNPSIILGKFLYMSPEQARHQPVDRRSDLYAVGLCLYELISGKNPFDGLHPGELMAMVANPKVPPLDEVEPLTPRAVTALVSKALEVDPTQRFQTAEEFRGRLQACLLEIDVSAGPESVSKFMRDLFAADFQSERRLLGSLKEVPRGGYGTGEVRALGAEPEDSASGPRPTLPAGAMLPAKTIRLDGPVEALSFHPTPRSREAGGPVNDGETRPGIPIDESTRPAFPLEALEEEARARAARLHSDTMPSVEVQPEVLDRPAAPPPPAASAASRPASMTREVPIAVVPPEAFLPGTAPAPRPPAPEHRPAPEPRFSTSDVRPSGLDARPTELELKPIGALGSPDVTSETDVGEPPASMVEPTEPRAEPYRTSPELRAAASRPVSPSAPSRAPAPPPPPPAPLTTQQRLAVAPPPTSGASPRTSQVMMQALVPGAGAPSSRSQAPAASAEEAEERDSGDLPVLTPEQMGHDEQAMRLAEMDTHPRANRPVRPERHEDTQPRAVREADTDPRLTHPPEASEARAPRPTASPSRAVHDDTQPRVVLDEALLREVEEEERASRPKTGARRLPRASSPGMAPVPSPSSSGRRTGSSQVRPVSAPVRVAEEEEEDADVRVSIPSHDETRRTSVPVRPNAAQAASKVQGEDTRRTTVPRRETRRSSTALWVTLGGVLLVAMAAGALVLFPEWRQALAMELGLAPVPGGPTPAQKLGQSPPRTPPPAQPQPESAPPPTEPPPPPSQGAAPAQAAPGAGTATAEKVAEDAAPPPAPAVAAAPPEATKTDAPAPVAAPPEDDDNGDSLLAPLASATPAPKPPTPKRNAVSKTRSASAPPLSKAQAELKREWKEAKANFALLTKSRSCEGLGFVCNKFQDLEQQIDETPGEPSQDLISKVRKFNDYVKKQLER
ncbi:protein kinase [Myxococcus sp. K15C18031901]|uniref:serine/threonine-protein kinase n=1 Tax=Myxococcus dinghuensis TaxID=2906761 RepID=UPI0020A736D9|nr:serine/threonine-protein kinase [Myxococcus dinghuensis]MCP3100571.1 protein kinase [Myxococcus dinghuensis]